MSLATSQFSREGNRNPAMVFPPLKLCSSRPKRTSWPCDSSLSKTWLLVLTAGNPFRPETRNAPATRLPAASSKPLYFHAWTWKWEQYLMRWHTKSVPSTSSGVIFRACVAMRAFVVLLGDCVIRSENIMHAWLFIFLRKR